MGDQNKTIYVREEAEPIFDKAQQVSGESLSRTIEITMREYAGDPAESMLDLANSLEHKVNELQSRVRIEEVKDEKAGHD